MKYCSNCGAVADGMKFCSECGTSLNTTETTSTFGENSNDIINQGISSLGKIFEFAGNKAVDSLSVFAFGKAKKCPKCRSTNVTFMSHDQKLFTKGKDNWHCQNCGIVFKK
ncbi:TPA: zinc ribbon domain-containing protein [Streptococcus suis]